MRLSFRILYIFYPIYGILSTLVEPKTWQPALIIHLERVWYDGMSLKSSTVVGLFDVARGTSKGAQDSYDRQPSKPD
jgi:hypothetical protein